MGYRSWRGRHPIRAPPRLRPITVRCPRTNTSMRYHHRRIRSDEHRAHRRLQSSLGGEGHTPGNYHHKLECDDCDRELARNGLIRNPAARRVDRLPALCFPSSSASSERQTAARTRKPGQPQAAELQRPKSYWVDTEGTRKPGQPPGAEHQ